MDCDLQVVDSRALANVPNTGVIITGDKHGRVKVFRWKDFPVATMSEASGT